MITTHTWSSRLGVVGWLSGLRVVDWRWRMSNRFRVDWFNSDMRYKATDTVSESVTSSKKSSRLKKLQLLQLVESRLGGYRSHQDNQAHELEHFDTIKAKRFTTRKMSGLCLEEASVSLYMENSRSQTRIGPVPKKWKFSPWRTFR